MAKGAAFWIFFVFGTFTVILAFSGGFYAFLGKGTGSVALGSVLLFMGMTLAVTLGSLLFIRMKEKRKE